MIKLFFIFMILISSAINARMGNAPPSLTYQIDVKNKVQTIGLKSIDVNKLLDIHKPKSGEPKPLQFAIPTAFDISPQTHGTWTKVPDGNIWNLRFVSKGATDMNFGFDKFNIPVGAELYIISLDSYDSYYDGPYTTKDVQDHDQFWTAVVPGGDVALELFVPTKNPSTVNLHLTQVSTGFRDAFKRYGGEGFNPKQGNCNNDVICSVADLWRDEIKSVSRYTINGSSLCTGTLIMDEPRSFKPYFLTAYHCGVTAINAATVVTYWNYESANCGDLSGGFLAQTVSGSTFKARRQDVDMNLLELSSTPPESFGVYWAGWDRSGTTPSGSVGIHHPLGDEKAISFNEDPLSTVNSCIGSGGMNTHWEVDNWENGTTEPGSSGSGLWDPSSYLLVGFLSGGLAACGNSEYDCYGKFSVAWTDGGSNPATKLHSWLDPNATGVNSISGADPMIVFANGFELH